MHMRVCARVLPCPQRSEASALSENGLRGEIANVDTRN